MILNVQTKQLINSFINDIAVILDKYSYNNINKDLYSAIRDEINYLHQSYKDKNKIFNLIFAYPSSGTSNNLFINIGADRYLQDGAEIDDYIIDCIDAWHLLRSL